MPVRPRTLSPFERPAVWPPLTRDAADPDEADPAVALAAHLARQAGAAARQATDLAGIASAPPAVVSGAVADDRTAGAADRDAAMPGGEGRDAGAVAASVAAPFRASGTDRPSVPVVPFGRPGPGVRDATLRLVELIGLPLICPHRACRRGRRCADPHLEQLPFCFFQHRGTARFVLAVTAARLGATAGRGETGNGETKNGEAENGGAGRERSGTGEGARPAGPAVPSRAAVPRRTGVSRRPLVPPGETLLGRLAAAGAPIASLARPCDGPADEWTWEREPAARALLAAARRAGEGARRTSRPGRGGPARPPDSGGTSP